MGAASDLCWAWRPGPLRPLLRVEPAPGISDSVHHLYRADSATHIGEVLALAVNCSTAWLTAADRMDSYMSKSWWAPGSSA